jgi:hypothetical protein
LPGLGRLRSRESKILICERRIINLRCKKGKSGHIHGGTFQIWVERCIWNFSKAYILSAVLFIDRYTCVEFNLRETLLFKY